jgi:hypothetical protein
MTLEGLNEDFRDLLVLFADAGVEFVIVLTSALTVPPATSRAETSALGIANGIVCFTSWPRRCCEALPSR